NLGHLVSKGAKIIGHGLINKYVSISKEQNSFLDPCFPKTPDNLKGGISLPRSRSHNQQNSFLPIRHSFNGSVYGDPLVIAGLLSTGIDVVRLSNNFFFLWIDAFPLLIPFPKFLR